MTGLAGRRGATMGNLFGRKKQSRVTEQDRAILVRGRRRAGGRALWVKLRRESERAALPLPSRAQLQTPGAAKARPGKTGIVSRAWVLIRERRCQEGSLWPWPWHPKP